MAVRGEKWLKKYTAVQVPIPPRMMQSGSGLCLAETVRQPHGQNNCLANGLIIQNSKKMQTKVTQPLSPRHSLPPSTPKNTPNTNPHLSTITPLTLCLLQRNRIIDLLYRAQKSFQFSRSSLHLAVGVLDKLICLGFPLNNTHPEVLGGSLLLLATKFNEIYAVTVKKLHLFTKEPHPREKYTDMQSAILHCLDFNLYLEDSLYEQLALLESQHLKENSSRCQELVKLALLNPSYTFKYGSKPLILAIESHLSVCSLTERPPNNSQLLLQTRTLKSQLLRLHSENRRLKSPKHF